MPITREYTTEVSPNENFPIEQTGSSLAVERNRVLTLFISDVHLGTRACQAELIIRYYNHCGWVPGPSKSVIDEIGIWIAAPRLCGLRSV